MINKKYSVGGGIKTLENNLNMKLYSAPSQLGLTNGSATIKEIYNTMSNNCVYMSSGSLLLSSELPNTYSSVLIAKPAVARSFIFCFLKDASIDYRMFLSSSNEPTGVWISDLNQYNGYSLSYLTSERITSGSNLNNYTTAGSYYIQTITDAQNISNTPVNTSGMLKVYAMNSYGDIIQEYMTYNNGDIWIRKGTTSNTWDSWHKLATSSS